MHPFDLILQSFGVGLFFVLLFLVRILNTLCGPAGSGLDFEELTAADLSPLRPDVDLGVFDGDDELGQLLLDDLEELLYLGALAAPGEHALEADLRVLREVFVNEKGDLLAVDV